VMLPSWSGERVVAAEVDVATYFVTDLDSMNFHLQHFIR
jgi:hypothetical protein